MSRDEIHKLLGGYATGTLTPEEQQTLFEAALGDQELFDTLAREQSLRDLLRDPAARAHLLTALDDAPTPWYRAWWRRPAPLAGLAVALSLVAIVAVRQQLHPAQPTMIPKVERPAATTAESQPAPASPAAPLMDQKAATQPAPARARQAISRDKETFAAVDKIEAGKLEESKAKVVAAAPAAPPAAPPPPPTPPANKPGALTETVTVTAATGLIEANNADVNRALKQQLKDLPANARNALEPQDNRRADAALSKGIPAPPAVVPAAQQALPSQLQQIQVPQQSLQQQAASGFLSSANTEPAAAGHLAIDYRILRKLPNGDTVDVDPDDGNIPAGATVNLQITPSENGYLRILESGPSGVWRELVNRQVERMKQFETMPMQFDAAGKKQLNVSFSRRPFDTAPIPAPEKDVVKENIDGSRAAAGLAGAIGGAGGGGGRGGRGAPGSLAAKRSTAAPAAPSHVMHATSGDATAQLISIIVTLNIH